jgi:hypothetical protein
MALSSPLLRRTAKGGGIIVDPFNGQPAELRAVPRCDAGAWRRLVTEARSELARKTPRKPVSRHAGPRKPIGGYGRTALERIDARTRVFLDGRTPQGTRNVAAFAASCNLLGAGVGEAEAERLILAGAVGCGLPEREARTAFASAVGAMRQRARR